jgi:hypothetical protein
MPLALIPVQERDGDEYEEGCLRFLPNGFIGAFGIQL